MIKHFHITETIKINVAKSNQNLIRDFLRTFCDFFEIHNNINLDFEIVEKVENSISYYFFTSENIAVEQLNAKFNDAEIDFKTFLFNKPLTKSEKDEIKSKAVFDKPFVNSDDNKIVNGNRIEIDGNGNFILQDINGSYITVNYNDINKLDNIILSFKQSQTSENSIIIQHLEFVKNTIVTIRKFHIEQIDQLKELKTIIEKGFADLHFRHDKHDESFINIENKLNNIENKYKQSLSPALLYELENIKNLILNESTQNALVIVNELMDWIDIAEQNLSKELADVYRNLKKSDNWQMKVKFAFPFLSILGINISLEHEHKLNGILNNIGTRIKRLINI